MKNKRVYFDTEFTELHQKTTLISIGLVSDDGSEFYAEFTDFDPAQVTPWISDNVLANLHLTKAFERIDRKTFVKGESAFVVTHLREWLADQGEVQIWSDCLAYDWVLFCELFGGALKIPKTIYYIPFDLCTLLLAKEIDPDISREKFGEIQGAKHNALHDARAIKACVDKLI